MTAVHFVWLNRLRPAKPGSPSRTILMRVALALCVALFCLGACKLQASSVSTPERARFLAETLEDDAACAVYRGRLSDRAVDAEAIAHIYDEAKKAGCLKRDI